MSTDAEASKKLLVKRRGGHRAYVTKIINEVTDIVPTSTPEEKFKLTAYLKILEDRKNIINDLDNQVLAELGEDEIEKDIIESGDFHMTIEETLIALTDNIERLTVKDEKKSAPTIPPLEGGGRNSMDFDIGSAKLPKLVLKPFSGEILKFQEFWECFDSAVHSNKNLDKVLKFNYLRSLLIGEATNAISGLSLTGDNYDEAVNILHSRFGNKQVIISAHIDNLLNLKPVFLNNDVKNLRGLYSEIEINVRSLKNLDVSSSHYGPILISLVMSKLPDDIKLIVSRTMAVNNFDDRTSSKIDDSTKEWKIDELLRILKNEIESRELCGFMANTVDKSEKFSKRNHSNPFTSSSLIAAKGDEPSYYCTYCGQSHASWKCTTVTDVQSRKSILKKKGRCFLCLQSNHISKFCPAKYRCAKCKGKHNISICMPQREKTNQNEQEQKKEKEAQRVAASVIRGEAGNSKKDEADEVTKNEKSTTFLQSAKAIVTDMFEKCSVTLRILFDNGSQKSFITKKIADYLHLMPIRKEKLIINGFAGKEEKLVNLDVVAVSVKNTDGEKCGSIELYVVPFICKPICDQPIELAQATYEHLIDLKLADVTDGESKLMINMLIGADYYWDYVKDDVIRCDDKGPTAIRTSLGWVLSGNMIDTKIASSNLVSAHVMLTEAEEVDERLVDERLDDIVQKFWRLDEIETSGSDEKDVLEKFKETLIFKNGRYSVSLPWKETTSILADNFQLCKARLVT